MENIKVAHIGEDYGTIQIDEAEFECQRGLAEALKKFLKAEKESRRWNCQDESCKGTLIRDYQTLAEVGSPYCPICDNDMELKS